MRQVLQTTPSSEGLVVITSGPHICSLDLSLSLGLKWATRLGSLDVWMTPGTYVSGEAEPVDPLGSAAASKLCARHPLTLPVYRAGVVPPRCRHPGGGAL